MEIRTLLVLLQRFHVVQIADHVAQPMLHFATVVIPM